MNADDFDYLCGFLKKSSGLILKSDKMYLVESRLLPIVRARKLDGLETLVRNLRFGADSKLIQDVMEAMTTNESFFFRDKTPFDSLRNEILPKFAQTRKTRKQLNIWSAASSTGQEPYSIAMVLKDMQALLGGWHFDIVGTDISKEVLEKARAGIYSQFEVQRGLPIQMLIKHFKQIGEMWQIEPAIRAMVKFKECNLLADFKGLGQFDVIFCRNVLIYFDQETKKNVLERMAAMMPHDGVLMLGAAETVVGLTNKLVAVKGLRGVYAKPEPAGLSGAAPFADVAPRPELAVRAAASN